LTQSERPSDVPLEITVRIPSVYNNGIKHQTGGRMAIKNWGTKTSRVVYRRFEAGESIIEGLESLALSEGIREAAVISCIGSLSQLKRRNLCGRKDGVSEHERETINEILELVSAEGYVQPTEEGGIRVHIHIAAARPSGEIVGGHCEDATCFTGAYMYLQVIEDTQS
jgi:hypothetical protein